MTVDEILTKFSFKADTGAAKKFSKVTDKIRETVEKTDDAWTKVNKKLSSGFQATWFDQFSKKVTDLRRAQLFLGGIRRGVDMISNVVPGLKTFSKAITGITKNYNQFVSKLINVRSALRSFGTLLGKSVSGIAPMVKSEMKSMVTIIKSGVAKALLFLKGLNFSQLWLRMKTGLGKARTVISTGFKNMFAGIKQAYAKFLNFLTTSNNVFIRKIGGTITKIQSSIKRMKGISALGKKIQSLTANVPGLGKLTSAFSAFGLGAVAALAGIVIGIIAVVKAIGALINKVKQSTKDFIAFETGMKGVQRVTLASAEDMGRLEEAAIAAGEASVFGVKDAADAQRFLAMAGLSVDEVIGALPGTLQLAAAAEMDLAQAADIATNIMSSNALEVADLARVNDILAFSASHSNQNVAQLGSAIQNIGPAGRLASLSIEDMSSWLSILANNGLRGQEAGTMVRNAIMDLVNPTDKMSASLASAGVNLSDFVDSAGKIKNINNLMMALQGMSEAARADFLGTLDARTYRALAPIITGNVEEMAKFNDELSQAGGTAEKMAALAFKGLDGALKEYRSKTETANVAFMKDSGLNTTLEELVRIGTSVLPELWKTLGLLLKPITLLLNPILKILRFITTVIGGLLKRINGILRAFFNVINKGVKPFSDGMDQIIKGTQKIFDLLSATSKGPMKWISKSFEWIGTLIGNTGKGLLKWLIGPLLFVVDLLLNLFLIILPNAVESFFTMIKGWYENSFLGKAGGILGDIGDFFTGGGDDNGGDGIFSGSGPMPDTKGISYHRASVGKIETNITVRGGMTNEDTAAAVSEAVNVTMAGQLRALAQEVE